jgi:desampylase
MEAASPREACGLLLGARSDAGYLVSRIVPVPNISPAEDAFQLDPLAWRSAELAAREEGLEVLGVWHSHPRSDAEPSARDHAGAQAGWSHVICAAKGERAIRSFYSLAGRLLEQDLH